MVVRKHTGFVNGDECVQTVGWSLCCRAVVPGSSLLLATWAMEDSVRRTWIISFNKHFLGIYHMQHILLGAGDASVFDPSLEGASDRWAGRCEHRMRSGRPVSQEDDQPWEVLLMGTTLPFIPLRGSKCSPLCLQNLVFHDQSHPIIVDWGRSSRGQGSSKVWWLFFHTRDPCIWTWHILHVYFMGSLAWVLEEGSPMTC